MEGVCQGRQRCVKVVLIASMVSGFPVEVAAILTVKADSIARAFLKFGFIRKGLISCSSSKGQML